MQIDPVGAEICSAVAEEATVQQFPARSTSLGSLEIRRALPVREKRLVGPWCFLDRYGPLSFTEGRPMDVAPHPHIGLQTVSWLLDGEVLHQDSIGQEAIVRAGGAHIMTAGDGIAHAETTPAENRGRLDGVQLWVALPDAERHREASFQHIAEVPVLETEAGMIRIFSGSLDGTTSPAAHFSPLVGADLELRPNARLVVRLDRAFEHGLFVLSGDLSFDRRVLGHDALHYFGRGRTELPLSTAQGARVLLVGGVPFPETIVMWWNFVARTPEEIVEARRAWEEGRHFGSVEGYRGLRLEAPPLGRLARPNPAS